MNLMKEYKIYNTKEFRENNTCPIRGIIDGEEAFTGETEKDDFVVLK